MPRVALARLRRSGREDAECVFCLTHFCVDSILSMHLAFGLKNFELGGDRGGPCAGP